MCEKVRAFVSASADLLFFVELFDLVLAYTPAHVELGQVSTWYFVLVSCTTRTMRRTRCWRQQRARWQTCSWATWTSSSCIGQSLATRAPPWSRPSRRPGRRALPLLPASALQRHSAGTLLLRANLGWGGATVEVLMRGTWLACMFCAVCLPLHFSNQVMTASQGL